MHRCHALGCNKKCPSEFLMCAKHWRMVSARIKQLVFQGYYQSGHHDLVSIAAQLAIYDVAIKEGRLSPLIAEKYANLIR